MPEGFPDEGQADIKEDNLFLPELFPGPAIRDWGEIMQSVGVFYSLTL